MQTVTKANHTNQNLGLHFFMFNEEQWQSL